MDYRPVVSVGWGGVGGGGATRFLKSYSSKIFLSNAVFISFELEN